jgi:hypothetical protein
VEPFCPSARTQHLTFAEIERHHMRSSQGLAQAVIC